MTKRFTDHWKWISMYLFNTHILMRNQSTGIVCQAFTKRSFMWSRTKTKNTVSLAYHIFFLDKRRISLLRWLLFATCLIFKTSIFWTFNHLVLNANSISPWTRLFFGDASRMDKLLRKSKMAQKNNIPRRCDREFQIVFLTWDIHFSQSFGSYFDQYFSWVKCLELLLTECTR